MTACCACEGMALTSDKYIGLQRAADAEAPLTVRMLG